MLRHVYEIPKGKIRRRLATVNNKLKQFEFIGKSYDHFWINFRILQVGKNQNFYTNVYMNVLILVCNGFKLVQNEEVDFPNCKHDKSYSNGTPSS